MHSQGGSTRDNLDELGGNTGLASAIVLDSKLFKNFSSVFGSVLHSGHTGGLLTGGVVEESNPEVGCNVKFVESGVRGVLVGNGLVVELSEGQSLEEAIAGHELHFADNGADS